MIIHCNIMASIRLLVAIINSEHYILSYKLTKWLWHLAVETSLTYIADKCWLNLDLIKKKSY